MKPIKFKEANGTFAANQPEYLPLPAHKAKDGQVISNGWGKLIQNLDKSQIIHYEHIISDCESLLLPDTTILIPE